MIFFSNIIFEFSSDYFIHEILYQNYSEKIHLKGYGGACALTSLRRWRRAASELEGGGWRLLAGGGVGDESLVSRYCCPRNPTESEGTRVAFGGCCLPRTRRREERSPDSPATPPAPFSARLEAAAATETASHLPPPLPLVPPPGRARSAPHPRPPARYAAAMSAQAQMRAMLDQLMGTSRDD